MNKRWLQVAGASAVVVASIAAAQGCSLASERTNAEDAELVGTTQQAITASGTATGTGTASATGTASGTGSGSGSGSSGGSQETGQTKTATTNFNGRAPQVIATSSAVCARPTYLTPEGDNAQSAPGAFTVVVNNSGYSTLTASTGGTFARVFQKCTWSGGKGFVVPTTGAAATATIMYHPAGSGSYDVPAYGTDNGGELTASYSLRTVNSTTNPPAYQSNIGYVGVGIAGITFRWGSSTGTAFTFDAMGGATVNGISTQGLSDNFGVTRNWYNQYNNNASNVFKVTVNYNRVPANFRPDAVETSPGSNIWVVKPGSVVMWRTALPADSMIRVCPTGCSVYQCQNADDYTKAGSACYANYTQSYGMFNDG